MSSFCLIIGMLIILAAATAVKGTKRANRGFKLAGTIFIPYLLNPIATTAGNIWIIIFVKSKEKKDFTFSKELFTTFQLSQGNNDLLLY